MEAIVTKRVPQTFRFPAPLTEELKRKARQDNRSYANYVETLLLSVVNGRVFSHFSSELAIELEKAINFINDGRNEFPSGIVGDILWEKGYRPYNEETEVAMREAEERRSAGTIDPTSFESFLATAFDEED